MQVQIGRVGVWLPSHLWNAELAQQVEKLGFSAIWVGGSPPGDLGIVDTLLDATDHVAVATGIVNVWKDEAPAVAASYHRVTRRYPGRFLLGLGVGHPEATQEYARPYNKLVAYLDQLDASDVPVGGRVLAALGPKVLELASKRAAGAHPYLTTPEHTRSARQALGTGPLLAPEQKVLLSEDPSQARATARAVLERYLQLKNYRHNLLRFGWSEADLDHRGSDRLVDALVCHGDADTLAQGVTVHLDAGADHVAVQPVGPAPYRTLLALSQALGRDLPKRRPVE